MLFWLIFIQSLPSISTTQTISQSYLDLNTKDEMNLIAQTSQSLP